MSSTKNARTGTTKSTMFGLPRGLSLRLFDNSSLTSGLFSSSSKSGVPNGSSVSDPLPRSAAQPTTAGAKFASAQNTFFHPVAGQLPTNSAVDNNYARKGPSVTHGYGVYPGGSRYTYILEASVSSKSDLQSLSDRMSPHDADDDSIMSFSGEISSVRACSSTETLLSTLALTAENHHDDSDVDDALPTHPPSRIVPANLPALIVAQKSTGSGIINLSLPEGSGSSSDSDSDSTAAGEPCRQRTYCSTSAARPDPRQIHPSNAYPARSAAPAALHRQDMVVRDEQPGSSRQSKLDRPVADGRQAFPPGLSSSPPPSPVADRHPELHSAPPPVRRERRESFSVPAPRPNEPPVLSRPPDARVAGPSSSAPSRPPPQRSRTLSDQSQRPTLPPSTPAASNRMHPADPRDVVSAPAQIPQAGAPARPQPILNTRCVRWNENLICPSPIPTHQRRKGWFNRRGDQLWTNVGAYKPAPQGQEYPLDLQNYPDYGVGWMNEEGVRIDMQHRLMPKVLRSALKRPKYPQGHANSI
ncbi:hypothetical protein HETIRDRAFT_455408 [Heterobasidion irregulare TC 32-1]|uniref:Uncharacterized protein n=1 Tax=Heterobasidion irregulare (strain TC 32-1) TaxID=747525 RepID=W4JQ90_HETIT|nr:uncharacterized protein HETIRDRAFT_455408 [Heterobasidion irregulare TC 32-1]ETW75703.1 hypothetical protein HETIRDRAFT_455408 [Heterobasidion irregulare TC 32-1]